MADFQGPNMSREWNLEFGNALLDIIREEKAVAATCIDCQEEIDVPFYQGQGFHREGPLCVACAHERAKVELEWDEKRESERSLRELEINRATWARQDEEREERIQRQVNSWRWRGEIPPPSAWR